MTTSERARATVLMTLLAIPACADPTPPPPPQELLRFDFQGSGQGWYYMPASSATYATYTPSGVACEAGEFPPSSFSRQSCYFALFDHQAWWGGEHLESRGPWWVDPNHYWGPGQWEAPGFGFINIIAFRRLEPAVDLRGAVITFRVKKSVDFAPKEVVGGTVSGSAEPRQGHLYLWFETASMKASAADACNEATEHPYPPAGPGPEDSCRNHDYILEAVPLEVLAMPAGDWVELRIPVTEYGWRCIGGGPSAGVQQRYGCVDDISRALSRAHAFGFVVAPVPPAPHDEDCELEGCGSVSIDDVVVTREAQPQPRQRARRPAAPRHQGRRWGHR